MLDRDEEFTLSMLERIHELHPEPLEPERVNILGNRDVSETRDLLDQLVEKGKAEKRDGGYVPTDE